MRGLQLLLFVILLPGLLGAQQTQDEVGNWIMYFGMNRLSDKWSLHSEVQYRNHTISPTNIEQLMLRTGMNYHFADNAMLTAGYAYIPSYVFESEQSEPETTEHRIWQQLIVVDKVGRIKLEHRYRVEQRWVNDVYRDRFRYRLMAFVPLNKPVIEKGTIFLGLYDEIFVNAEQIFFDRNRLYGAVGYQLSKSAGVQAGYLHQQVNAFGKHYVQFALVLNPDFRSSE